MLITIVLILLATTLILYLFNNYVPVYDVRVRQAINVLVIVLAVALCIWVALRHHSSIHV